MAYGNNQRVHIFYSTHILQLYSIETLRLCAVCGLIHQHRLDAVLAQLFYNIDNLCISGIRAVLLEGKAKDRNLRMLYRDICANQVLHNVFCDIFAHVVVDAAAGQNDLGMIAHLLCAVGQIIRIDTDAVSAHQTGIKFQEIPFGSCCL